MIIRKMTAEDALQHEIVASQAFVYTFDPSQTQSLPNENMYGCFAEDNKTLMSEIQLDNFHGHYCKGILSCAAVSGVASKPENRQQGSIRSLFVYLFENNRKFGYDYSVLYPFSEAFYEKFGYINAGFTVKAEIPMALLSQFPVNTSVWLYEGKESERLYDVYNAWASQYVFAFFRNNPHYFSEKPFETAMYTYIYRENLSDAGFVTLSVNRKEKVLSVHEIGYLNHDAVVGLLGFLRVFAGACQTVRFEKLPQDTPILQLLTEYHEMNISLHPMGAIRVMNIKSLIEKTHFPVDNASLTFKSNDIVPENNGCFQLQINNGRATLEKLAPCQCDVELSQVALSEMLLLGLPNNFISLSYRKGFTFNRDNSDILRLFPKRNIYFSDSF